MSHVVIGVGVYSLTLYKSGSFGDCLKDAYKETDRSLGYRPNLEKVVYSCDHPDVRMEVHHFPESYAVRIIGLRWAKMGLDYHLLVDIPSLCEFPLFTVADSCDEVTQSVQREYGDVVICEPLEYPWLRFWKKMPNTPTRPYDGFILRLS